MNTDAENSLEQSEDNLLTSMINETQEMGERQLENCCESACEKYHIKNYIAMLKFIIESQEKKINELKEELNG